jgi:hypothetical protein
MSSCRQILVSLLKAPLVTIHKRLNTLPAGRPLQHIASSASTSGQQPALPSTVNSSTSQDMPQKQRSVLRWGVPYDPNAKENAGFRKLTKEEIEKTSQAELEGREYGPY